MANPTFFFLDVSGLADSVASSDQFVSPQSLVRRETIIHELGSDLQDSRQSVAIDVKPSAFPTRVEFTSEVRAQGARGLRSPAYMAVVRRRETDVIRKEINALASQAGRSDFLVCVFPTIDRIKKLLSTLANAEEEGNSREILRRLRNTLQNGHWERYREPRTRTAAATILQNLAQAEEVLPFHVAEAARMFEAEGNAVSDFFAIDEGEPCDQAKVLD